MSQPKYLFGDCDSAAQRLKLLARVYEASTRAFLARAAGSARFRLALDLGCGPGFTTYLINGTLRCDRVIGLDASASFIKLAQAASGESVSFLQHDVTAIPFPSGCANLIFARFLLTHLRDPDTVVAKWATQLERGGLILLDETEAIHTVHPAFGRYLALVEAMLASQSNRLYAGRFIADLNPPGGLKCTFSELHSIPVRNCDAARMFALNLNTWKGSEFVRTNYSPGFIRELENDLAEIAAIESPAKEIAWEMRQSAWLKE
ncbi:MAG: class I SAM-dependent methyltransferase [Deltaproteobacteria bacterium]|nr:class I SAM-dependent methyltransferase [Deltaproteobacteria bacterium]